MVLVFLFAGCASAPELPGPVLELGEVIANAGLYNGKVITVRGFASIFYEDYGLWASRNDFEKRNQSRCISLMNRYSDEAMNDWFDLRTVTLRGTFHASINYTKEGVQIIRLGGCGDTGIRIDIPPGIKRDD